MRILQIQPMMALMLRLLMAVTAMLIGYPSHAQQERIDKPDCSYFNDAEDLGRWNEYHFERVEGGAADALATDGKAIWVRLGRELYGKEVYGYNRFDGGTGQSIHPCPEPGSQYTFSARARLSAPLTSEDPGKVFIEFENASGVKVRAVEFLVTSTSYTVFTQTFTVPADAVWCRVFVMKKDAVEADLYVDSVSLKATVNDTPSRPTNLTVTETGSTMARLQWDAVAGASAYLIERKYSTEGSGSWRPIHVTLGGGGQTTFLDTLDYAYTKYLEEGFGYNYRISAMGDYGNSIPSLTATTTLVTRSSSPGNTTYYIDATGGSDLNSGTSEGAAWKTFLPLDRINLAGGDTVLLKKGEIWNEPMHLHGSGILGNEIRVSSYGTAGEKPKIDPGTKAHAAIRMLDVSHCIVSDLEISNYHPFHGKMRRFALEAGAWQSPTVSNLTFDNLLVTNVTSVKNRGGGGSSSDGKTGTGLRIVGNIRVADDANATGVFGTLSDVSVVNCVFDNIEMNAMQFQDVDNALIQNNTTDNIGYQAICARRLTNSRISNNLFQRAGIYLVSNDNAHIDTYELDHVVIEHNVIDRTYNVASGQSIALDGGDNSIVQYNYFKDSDAGTIVFNRQAYNNIIRYNICEGMGAKEWIRNLGGVSNYVYNNTVYLKEGQDVQIFYNGHVEGDSSLLVTDAFYYNNIIYSEGGALAADLIESLPGTTGAVYSNNVYFGDFTDTPSEDSNPLYNDPLFVGVANGDPESLKLGFSSPYGGAGLLISNNGGLDFFGNAVASGGPPAIGAHEYGSDPLVDSDGDKMPDQWEIGYSLNPVDPDDAQMNSDYDRLVNLLEFAFGGNPLDGGDTGHPVSLHYDGSNMIYIYPRRIASALSYRLETNNDLLPDWVAGGYTETGTESLNAEFESVTNEVPIVGGSVFLRLAIH